MRTMTQHKNKVLVTGGAGYIGSHTMIQLLEEDFDCVLVDNFSNSDRSVLNKIAEITGKGFIGNQFDSIQKIEKDSLIQNDLNFIEVDSIIHFAAYKSVGESVSEPLKYYDNNINSLLSTLTLAKKYDIKNIIFSSSCTVYGEPDTLPITEGSPIKLSESPYGRTKQICESILEDFYRVNPDKNIISLRYFNPIGAHPSGLIGEKPSGIPNNLVPYITQTAIGVRPELKVYGNDYNTFDGTCIRDYIHVCDLANCHVETLKWSQKQNGIYEVFNVGTGKGHSVLEVIKSFESVNSIKLNWSFDKRRPGDIEKIWADNSKIKKVIGWKPKFNLEDAMRHAWRFQISNPL